MVCLLRLLRRKQSMLFWMPDDGVRFHLIISQKEIELCIVE